MGYLAIHFLMVTVYSLTFDTESRFKYYSFAYCYPFFHQSWVLFVPSEQENYKLFVRYKDAQSTAEWKDLFSDLIAKHQNNRFGGNELIIQALSNALKFYSARMEQVPGIMTDRSNINFRILEKIVRQYYVNREKKNVEGLEILIVIENKNNTRVHYYPFE